MTTRHNVLANMFGRLWSALMSFAFVPVYIRLLGVEAYGLIGFFTSILGIFFVLDMGISTTLNREFARAAGQSAALAEMRTMLRSLELVYWVVGLILSVALASGAPLIARDWLNTEGIAVDEVVLAIRLMALTIFFRWPVTLYTGALMGLRRHVPLNAIVALNATLQGGGAALVLLYGAPTIAGFFIWQALIGALQVAALAALTWRSLRLTGDRPKFRIRSFRTTLGFSAGVSGITLLSIILTQLDKIVVSRFLPLETFGFYALATAIAGTLNLVAGSIFGGIFPAFSSAVARGAEAELSELYHKYSQLVAVLVVPAAAAVALFALDLLRFYVGDPRIAGETCGVLRLLIVANALLALMQMPLALQLANGWTRLSLVKNMVAVVVLMPLMIGLVTRIGMIGAGITWLLLTLGYVLIEVPVMHRRLLPADLRYWYLVDVARPTLVSGVVLGALRIALPSDWPVPARVAVIALGGLAAVVGSALALPELRVWLIHAIRRAPAAPSPSKAGWAR